MIITARNASLAALIALVLATAPALAQDFLIDGTFVNPDATNGQFADTAFDIDGTSVLMTNGSSIDVSDAAGDNAIQATGDNITIEARGALSTQGNGDSVDGNGMYVDGDGAVVILTGMGSITTVGERAYGQYIFGVDGFILNSGSITTVGKRARGQHILFGDDGIITNAGTITTGGDDAYGQHIFNGDDGIITNAGTITTGGGYAHGQYIQGGLGIITNTGSIATDGNSARGQHISGDDGRISNAGTIRTRGDDAYGQLINGNDGAITNTGSITTEGDDARGQNMIGFGGTITNMGVIETGGVGAFGQFLNGSNGTATNSGRLVSRQAAAIRIEDTTDNNTINLWAPGFIGGGIDFGDDPSDLSGPPTNTTVNIVTGQSHSIFWTLEGDDLVGGAPDISGSVPWFYNAATQSVATFDPTLFASETAALGDLTSMLSHVGLGALEGFEPGPEADTGFSALGYMPVAEGKADTVSHRVGRAWATALGGLMGHEGGGTTLDSTIGHIGIAAGYTWQQAPNTTLSAMTGYVAGNNKADADWSPSFDHDTHTLFAGLHGEHQLNRAAVQFGLTAGHSWIDHNRFVNDNLAPLGESWVSADYGGFFVSPELALSTDILLQNGMTLTPNAGLRYAAQWLGGYSETGAVSAAANATVEDRFVGTVEARAGLDITRSFDIGGRTGTVTGGIGYLGRWGGGDDDASVTLNGVTQSIASGHQDLNAVTVSATLLSDLGEKGFLEVDANYLVGDTAQGFDGSLKVGMTF